MKAYGLPFIITWVLAALFIALFGFYLSRRGRRGKLPPARPPSAVPHNSPGFVEWEKNNKASLAAVDAKVNMIMAQLGL